MISESKRGGGGGGWGGGDHVISIEFKGIE